jgi:hypothetical protein
MNHLDIYNTSYGKKKGRESNWHFDFRPLKAENRPNFLMCRQCVTHRWKALDFGYNFASDLIIIASLHAKLCSPKVAKARARGISGLALGSPKTIGHLDVAPMERCREYYMGEGGGFPRVRAVVSLMSPKLLVVCPITKGAPTQY